MQVTRVILFLLALLTAHGLSGPGGVAGAASSRRPLPPEAADRLLVLPFTVGEGVNEKVGKDSAAIGQTIARLLSVEAGHLPPPGWRVFEVGSLTGLLNDPPFKGSALDENLALELGRSAGIRYLVVGSFGEAGVEDTLSLYARMIDCDTGRVIHREYVNLDGRAVSDTLAFETKVQALGFKLGLRDSKPDPIPIGHLDVAALLNSVGNGQSSRAVTDAGVERVVPGAAKDAGVDVNAGRQNPQPLSIALEVLGGKSLRSVDGKIYNTVFREGESMSFRVTATRDCNVTLLYEDPADGKIYSLLPSPAQPDGSVKAGVATDIPAPVPGKRVTFSAGGPPFGPHTVKAIASPTPIQLEALRQAGISSAPLIELQTKSITIGKRQLPPKAVALFGAVEEFATAEVVVTTVGR